VAEAGTNATSVLDLIIEPQELEVTALTSANPSEKIGLYDL